MSLRTRPAATGALALPVSPPHPVTALITHRPDDLAVVDAAARPAAARNAPVPPVAGLSARRQPADHIRADVWTDRLPSAGAPPRLRSAGVGHAPVVRQVPAPDGTQARLRTAAGTLVAAARCCSPLVVASGRGPTGPDAHSLIEAPALRGGPFVHAVAPTPRPEPAADAARDRPLRRPPRRATCGRRPSGA
ncbi:universal stress protein [Streptomyces sp. NPDC051740]|uniref:universal stress protein n=1 Tax=Streptomyces sp. NPDC051740 TaxID=3365673 RepID=UPI0037932B2E